MTPENRGQRTEDSGAKPRFFAVTGRDFGRSIAWARRTPNAVAAQIRAALLRGKETAP